MISNYLKLVDNFRFLIENDRLGHAYVFSGENKDEKIVFAQSLANYLENKIFEKPLSILRETISILPDEKGVIGIDRIRDLKYFLAQKPHSSSRRTVIVQNAESLTIEAQNSALKIVEEPPPATLLIFLVNSLEDLLPPLISRFQKIYFSAAADPSVPGKLLKELPENISDSDIDKIFKNIIGNLRKQTIKNSALLKETLQRLVFIKQFNTNKKLQLKRLLWTRD